MTERELQRFTEACQRLSAACTRAAFGLLDMQLAATPLEDRPARSWEVEREEFMRRLDSWTPDSP